MSKTRGSAVCNAAKVWMPNRVKTPASNAEAISEGMRSATRSNSPVAPTRIISAEHTMNAPTASPMENPPATPAVANTAAPGVDHATITGLRSTRDGTSEHSPIPRPSAQIQEVIWAGVAPNPWAAWNTMATELVKPTNTATKPATKADRLISLKNCMGAHSGTPLRTTRPDSRRTEANGVRFRFWSPAPPPSCWAGAGSRRRH